MGDDQEPRIRQAASFSSSMRQKPFGIRIVQWRIDFVEHAEFGAGN